MPPVEIIPLRKDNYAYLLTIAGRAVVVDPSDAAPVLSILAEKNLPLDAVWCTHHHDDHVGGAREISQTTGAEVLGFRGDLHRIPAITRALDAPGRFEWQHHTVELLHIPGHTTGHIAFHLPALKLLFCGDTLFSAGCGRLFEGTPAQMLASLERLAGLPDDTQIYCGHEYTQNNIRFAQTLEPENTALNDYAATAARLRATGLPTLPSTIAREKAINPFLRTHSAPIRQSLNMLQAAAVEIFAELRSRKDRF